ncbi:MAG: hypothetical protein H6Q90_1217 [Deltaproteobacteria bacterium]|nr:hypothetical protein [Deltaproteobacteria bacterium]
MNTKVAKCLVVSKVLIADGIITDEEREFLATVMQTFGLTEDERRSVIDLEGLDEADAIVRGLPIEDRRQLLETLVDASSADGRLSAHELAAIKRVSAALGV